MQGMDRKTQAEITAMRQERAKRIAKTGSLKAARSRGLIPNRVDITLSEALVLGLINQGVRTFLAIFGHGSTEIGEVLRVYQEAGLIKVYPVRHEIEASHATMALRWVTGQKAAVVTSIGPGALQAMAGSIAAASDGIGTWYLFGDETTEDEGYNMQQIPKHEQNLFLQLTATLGRSYTLHTPLALPTALRRGQATVDHPYRAGPFYLLMPMNTQPAWIEGFNLDELPEEGVPKLGAAVADYQLAARMVQKAHKVLVKVGGGGRSAGQELESLLELSGGVLVYTPIASGAIPASNPRNMGVGGSKGSISGNFAMENADLLITVGTRAVCQSDCSRTGYPRVKLVINVNTDMEDTLHYGKTLPLLGDARATLSQLNAALMSIPQESLPEKAQWLQECVLQREAWQEHKAARYNTPVLKDAYWGEQVLTQPAVIKIATDWAKSHETVTFFDAGDVQANGFQIVEDEHPDQTFTETGASYMGFAVSALLATAIAERKFTGLAVTGDGSFTMNPQILIDGAEHGARGCILLLDNGRMAAISGLQNDQYGCEFATSSHIKVDYLSWAKGVPGVLALDGGTSPEELLQALSQTSQYDGLSFIRVKVYYGPDPLGGMGVFGRWNVGSWCVDTQALRHEIGL